ncbi:MAG: amidohydrolase family protein [Candidatus Bathyarchaeota archaeon]|nr:MAG: amidohydrolase family protein [Candidatus Bathyarchaeota archaeon]
MMDINALAVEPSSKELLIAGGEVAGPDGIRRADIRILGEFIAEVAPGLRPGRNARVIDASDRLILPGGIDPHTHLTPPFVDDLTSGSAAALVGGITTLGTFSYPASSGDERESLVESLVRMEEMVHREAIADIFLHPVLWPPSSASSGQLEAIRAAGQLSIKFFMLRRDFGATVSDLLGVMDAARDLGMVVLIHCEDDALLRLAAARLQAEGKSSLRYYAESRPVVSEVSATQQAVAFCEATGAPTYVVHLSSARALRACRNPDTRGLPLFVETRPIYLHLTEERYANVDGPLYVGQPPLRGPDDLEALWDGLTDGSIDVLATDHAPWTREQKLDPALDIENLRPGVNNLQVMLPMYFSEGVRMGRITVERFVETTSTNPARIFGLFPRKGVIQEGAYADVAVWDPSLKKTIRGSDMYSKAGFSIYEGWEVTGWPVLTIRRGEIVFEDEELKGVPGSGKLLRRDPWKPM